MPTGIYIRTEYHKEILGRNSLGNKSSCQFKKGHKGYWTGKKMPEEMARKCALSRSGDKNWKYKGEEAVKKTVAKYWELHRWVESELGKPRKCAVCKTEKAKQYDWANISHSYKKELLDWIRLCSKCHMYYDMGKIKI